LKLLIIRILTGNSTVKFKKKKRGYNLNDKSKGQNTITGQQQLQLVMLHDVTSQACTHGLGVLQKKKILTPTKPLSMYISGN
jgi:hypothetical protein